MSWFLHNRRPIAAAGVALALSLVGTGVAHAASQADVWSGYLNPVLAPGSAGKIVYQQVGADAPAPSTISGLTVTYDVSGLAGVAVLVPQTGTCTTSGSVITCRVGSISPNTYDGQSQNPYTTQRYLPVKLTPAPGAAAGASGTVAVTASAAGVASNGSSMSVSIADGPDLVLKGSGAGQPTVAVTAGSSFHRSVVFTNDGDQAAQGVTVEITASGHGVDIPELSKNCQYTAPGAAFCYIPDLIAPGASETLSPSVQLLTTTDLMWQGVGISVVPGYAALSNYTVGTGKPFTLVDSTGKAQTPVSGHAAQQNIDFSDTRADFEARVSGATADIAPDVSLSLGAQIFVQWQVQAGVLNNGPGYVQLSRSGDQMLTGDISVPAGVTFTSVPITWTPIINGVPDGLQEGSPGYSEYQFPVGIQAAPGGEAFSNGDLPVIETQPGFAGGSGTMTAGVNGLAPAVWVNAYFGNIDADTSNDTVTFNIPAYGSGS